MAIKRCPYCRALIDEKEQYCNNCGTQLLFPEDGEVEEEIPGEKIIDADVEEKDYGIPEPGAEAPGRDEEDEDDADEDEEDEEEEELDAGGEPDEDDEEEDEDEEEPEEVVVVDEPEREETAEAHETPEAGKPATSEMPVIFSAPAEEEPAPPPVIEPIPEKPVREPVPGLPAVPPKRPLTFDTADLDKIGRTAELGNEQVEDFMDVLKEREEEARLRRAGLREPDDSLPPWAAEMKDGAGEAPKVKVEMMREDDIEDRELEEPGDTEDEGTGEEPEERAAPAPARPRIADSGIGLPEKVVQAALPFEREAPREERAVRAAVPPARRPIEREYEEPAEEEVEEAREERVRPRGPFKLAVFLKAKGFDVLFVAVFWLASLWIAARSMDVTLFQMLGKASSGLLAYFAALLVLYFFLFYFFLGESLGDRLFRDDD